MSSDSPPALSAGMGGASSGVGGASISYSAGLANGMSGEEGQYSSSHSSHFSSNNNNSTSEVLSDTDVEVAKTMGHAKSQEGSILCNNHYIHVLAFIFGVLILSSNQTQPIKALSIYGIPESAKYRLIDT